MPQVRRRKCRHCGQLYQPNFRNPKYQKYCAEPACRRASKAASQAQWRASPEGRDYFRGPENARRVKAWQKAHPGYWKKRRKKPRALQDRCAMQVLAEPEDKLALEQITSGSSATTLCRICY